MAAKSLGGSEEELEKRIQTLTEHLLQKQNQLELALSEKTYFQLQFEQQQQSNKKSDNINPDNTGNDTSGSYTSISIANNGHLKKRPTNSNPSNVSKEDIYEEDESIAALLENTPYVKTVPRVVGAGRMLDSVSTITGSYLRTFPLLRLLAILYIVITKKLKLIFMLWLIADTFIIVDYLIDILTLGLIADTFILVDFLIDILTLVD